MSLYAKFYANLLLAPGSYLRGRKYDSVSGFCSVANGGPATNCNPSNGLN